MAETAQALQSLVQIAFGGLVFNRLPEIGSRIPGHYIGKDLTNIVPTIEQLIRQKPAHPHVKPISTEYQVALTHFQNHKAAIEAQTWEILSSIWLRENIGCPRAIRCPMAFRSFRIQLNDKDNYDENHHLWGYGSHRPCPDCRT